jgi:hypothetical protein
MTTAHRFPKATVSFDLTTSAWRAEQERWFDTVRSVVRRRRPGLDRRPRIAAGRRYRARAQQASIDTPVGEM